MKAYKILHKPTGLYLNRRYFSKRGKLYLKRPDLTQVNILVSAYSDVFEKYFKEDTSIINRSNFTRPTSEFEIEEYEIKKIEK